MFAPDFKCHINCNLFLCSTSSQHIEELGNVKGEKDAAYKIAMLGDSAVGKSSLTYQFTTSEYICAYDLSLGGFLRGVDVLQIIFFFS